MAGLTPEQVEQNFGDLDYTQNLRRRIVDKISDKAITDSDPEMLDLTLKTLVDMDKVSLGRLKINEKSKENETRADESAAMAQYLLTLSDRRQSGAEPQRATNETANRRLPDDGRPAYNPSVRDASAGNETTAEFTDRVEGKI